MAISVRDFAYLGAGLYLVSMFAFFSFGGSLLFAGAMTGMFSGIMILVNSIVIVAVFEREKRKDAEQKKDG